MRGAPRVEQLKLMHGSTDGIALLAASTRAVAAAAPAGVAALWGDLALRLVGDHSQGGEALDLTRGTKGGQLGGVWARVLKGGGLARVLPARVWWGY